MLDAGGMKPSAASEVSEFRAVERAWEFGDVVLDIGEDDRIVGIEILDASERLNLSELLPIQYRQAS